MIQQIFKVSEQGRRKHLKLWGGGVRNFEGTFVLKEEGAFYKNKMGISLFIAESLGHVPPVSPVPSSMFLRVKLLEGRQNFLKQFCSKGWVIENHTKFCTSLAIWNLSSASYPQNEVLSDCEYDETSAESNG